MPIPEMNQEGFLPVGVYDCTFAELQAAFGLAQALNNDAATEAQKKEAETLLLEIVKKGKDVGRAFQELQLEKVESTLTNADQSVRIETKLDTPLWPRQGRQGSLDRQSAAARNLLQ